MKKIILMVLMLFFVGCENKKDINIAANEWIGYAPIFYANEMGWLKKEHFRLIRTVSLGESLDLFKNGLVNSFAATQYEYNQVKNKVKPIILLDRSYGGDVIVSNKSLDELKKSKKIDVYLEMDSVNFLLFKYFAKKYNFPMSKFNFFNMDQQEISQKIFKDSRPVIVVTYSPYDVIYLKRGFREIASSKDKDLLIIDALFIDDECKLKRFHKLKRYIDLAIEIIKNNPKKAYEVLKNYYPNMSFDDFKKGLEKIKWVNHPKKELLNELKKIDFDTGNLVYED